MFGRTVSGFGSRAKRGSPLGITIDAGGTETLDVPATAGSGTISTGSGQIDLSTTATGGDGSYSYAWTVTETDDPTNSFSVNSAGTQNANRYNDLTLNVAIPASVHDPPNAGIYTLRCTVTDGTSATAFVEQVIPVTGIPTP